MTHAAPQTPIAPPAHVEPLVEHHTVATVPPLYLEPLPPMPLGLTTYGMFSASTSSNPGTGPSCTHSGGHSGNGNPHDCHMIPEPSALVLVFTALCVLYATRRQRSCFND